MNRVAIPRDRASGIFSAVVALLLVSSDLAGADTMAGIPDPATSSVPSCLAICPNGDRTFPVVVRDVAHIGVPFATVVIDLSTCADAEIELCDDCSQPANYDPVTRRFTRVADVLGRVTFRLCGTIQCPSSATWARVLANNVLLRLPINVVTTDLDGDGGVDAQDVAIVSAAQGGSLPPADGDCSGAIDASDVAVVEGHVGHGCAAAPEGVFVNEVVVDPQQDWEDSAGGNLTRFDDQPGTAVPNSGDEWIEIVNATGSTVDLTGWTLEMDDTVPAVYELGAAGATVRVHPPGSTLAAVPPGGIVVIGNPPGEMDNDVHILLRDPSDLIVDEVEIGDDPAGDGAGDGAPDPGADGNASSPADEAIARVPNLADTDDDVADFAAQAATIGKSNNALVGVEPPASSWSGLEVFPHPSRGMVRLTLHLEAEASELELTIHDAAGRRVLRETLPALASGPYPYTWTSPPRSGVYWVRVRGRAVETGQPIDLARRVTVLP